MNFVIHLKKLTLIPIFMLVAVIVLTSMSLSELGMSSLSYLCYGVTLLTFASLVVVCLYEKEMSRYGFLGFLFLAMLVSSTVINAQEIKPVTYNVVEIGSMYMFLRYYRGSLKVVVIGSAIGLSICVYANFLHMLNHPELWSFENEKYGTGYLLGNNYNQMGCRLISAVVCSILCLKYSKWWLLNVIPVILCSIIPLAIIRSMTSLSCIIMFLVFCVIPWKKLQRFAFASVMTVVILFQTFVVCSGKGLENNPLAVYIVVDVLEKDITFTHRTLMWDQALKVIADSPIIGHGMVDSDWYIKHMESFATGPHNIVLASLIHGGIILLGLYIALSYLSLRKLWMSDERMAVILAFGIASLMVMMLMEMVPYFFILLLLGLGYNYNDISQQAISKKKKEKRGTKFIIWKKTPTAQ